MPLTSDQIVENDRRFLLDFFSTGSSTHWYTAISLYHELQRIHDAIDIDSDEKPRIQTVLRAKIFTEAVASMETVGKLLYAIKNRNPDGIACRYVRGTVGHSEKGLRLFRDPNTDLIDTLSLPNNARDLTAEDDLRGMANTINKIYVAYLEPDEYGREQKNIVEAYQAVKHGSLIVNDPRKVSIWPVQANLGHVWMITNWPTRAEGREQLKLKEIGMGEGRVSVEIEICKLGSTISTNLCQLVIQMINQKMVSEN